MTTPEPTRELLENEAKRALLEDLLFAAVLAEAAGTRSSRALAERLDAAATRLQAEFARAVQLRLRSATAHAGECYMALLRVNGGPLPTTEEKR